MQPVPIASPSNSSSVPFASARFPSSDQYGSDTNLQQSSDGTTPPHSSGAAVNWRPSPSSIGGKSAVLGQHTQTLNAASAFLGLPNEILIHCLSHLSPSDLLSTTVVCHRLFEIIEHPDAWRTAFSRFFAGQESILPSRLQDGGSSRSELAHSNFTKRSFTRLTTFSSWRTEYIVRVRLLRSLKRGRPMLSADSQLSSRNRRLSSTPVGPIALHDVQLSAPLTMIHANFDSNVNSKQQKMMCASSFNGDTKLIDPVTGKLDRSWFTSNDVLFRNAFESAFHDHEMYGLGSGQIVGNPNPVDISRPYGVVVGEGLPEGRVSFRPVHERALQWLQTTSWANMQHNEDGNFTLGIPKVPTAREAICTVWIAKSADIPSLSNGMIGIMSGSSLGVVSAYSLGHVGMRDRSIARGEVTARWVLSPGVPIISLSVDEHYSLKRQIQNRIWAVAVNALGEVFYLTKFPARIAVEKRPKNVEKAEMVEKMAWMSARSVTWTVVEPSRRTAVPDPYGDQSRNGGYTPRSSWNGMCLSDEQIRSETVEISAFLNRRPNEFQQDCIGWDMERKVEIDFAGDDGSFAGEAILLISNPSAKGSRPVHRILRYIRVRIETLSRLSTDVHEMSAVVNEGEVASRVSEDKDSIFEQPTSASAVYDDTSPTDLDHSAPVEEWRVSQYETGHSFVVTCTALDCSKIANMTMSEDPLITANGSSTTSSGSSSPDQNLDTVPDLGSVPGQRARLVAMGTSTGSIIIWDFRAAPPKSQSYTHIVKPLRVIQAGSGTAAITSLAMNSLAIVHGDEEGLVQAWDPLWSQTQPLRTISSPFTGRMRRRILEAEALAEHTHSLASARAIVLDPDSTSLRGIVAIGTHIKHWQFRADDISGFGKRGAKRRRRKSSRSANMHTAAALGMTNRGGVAGFIEDEIREMHAERRREAKERDRLQQRFGVGMLGEDEELRLAMLLSEETFELESQSEQSTPRLASSEPTPAHDIDYEGEVAEAIQRSLEQARIAATSPTSPSSSSSTPAPWSRSIRLARRGARGLQRGRSDAAFGPVEDDALSDLELALMLSMTEQTAPRHR